MSEETGSGSTTAENTGTTAESAAGGTKTVANPEAQKYAAEAAARRTELRAAEAKITELEAKIKTGTAATGDPASIATLSRELAEVKERLDTSEKEKKQAQNKAAQRTLDSELSKFASKTLNPESAAILLRASTRVAADDTVEIRIKNDKGEDAWVALTEENVVKAGVIPPQLLPTEGKGGTGSRAGSGKVAGTFSYDEAMRSQKYHDEHIEEVRAEKERRYGRHK